MNSIRISFILNGVPEWIELHGMNAEDTIAEVQAYSNRGARDIRVTVIKPVDPDEIPF